MDYRLGVDFGGVINATDTDVDIFSENFLESPEVPQAIDTLTRLHINPFPKKLYVVSKCGPRVQERTRQWLGHQEFYQKTGIPPAHVEFCLKRSQKASICQRLGITHFADDKLEVLGYLFEAGIEHLYLFQGRELEIQRHQHYLSRVQRVESWMELEGRILATLKH